MSWGRGPRASRDEEVRLSNQEVAECMVSQAGGLAMYMVYNTFHYFVVAVFYVIYMY
jgi:hypothetical protein